MKRRSLLVSAGVVFTVLLLQYCKPDKAEHVINKRAHEPIEMAEFKNLSRKEQVQKCGSCHAREYENEMKGPHSAAFNQYMNHLMYVWSDEYTEIPYRHFLEANSYKCAGCHAGQNVYEKIWSASLRSGTTVPDSLKQILGAGPQCRSTDARHLESGIDCLTCHYDGEKVVTNFSFQSTNRASSPPYCSPSGSKLFSTNNNCITCHYEEVEKVEEQTFMTDERGKSCLKCHQQYNTDGSPSHYIYWRNDPADKPKPKHLFLFEGIEATYNAATRKIEVKWYNRYMPHLLTLATETRAHLKVLDQNGKIVAEDDLRLNRSAEHSKELQRYFGTQKIPYTPGTQLPLDGTALEHAISGINSSGKLTLLITGYQKAQYWLPDSLGKKVYERSIAL